MPRHTALLIAGLPPRQRHHQPRARACDPGVRGLAAAEAWPDRATSSHLEHPTRPRAAMPTSCHADLSHPRTPAMLPFLPLRLPRATPIGMLERTRVRVAAPSERARHRTPCCCCCCCCLLCAHSTPAETVAASARQLSCSSLYQDIPCANTYLNTGTQASPCLGTVAGRINE